MGSPFVDDSGQMFWVNGFGNCCYFSEQRQCRSVLSFFEVLKWRQFAPNWLVGQRFGSIVERSKAFGQNGVRCSYYPDLCRMGEPMLITRYFHHYCPIYIKLDEAKGAPVRVVPLINLEDFFTDLFSGPRGLWPAPRKKLCQDTKKSNVPIAYMVVLAL